MYKCKDCEAETPMDYFSADGETCNNGQGTNKPKTREHSTYIEM